MVICTTPLCLPVGGGKNHIRRDLDKIGGRIADSKVPQWLYILYFLHTDKWFRSLFYYRSGPLFKTLFGWYRPGDNSLIIPASTTIGAGVSMEHAYSTVLNAEKIGDNFSFMQCTTIGVKTSGGKRPVIGNNVSLGAGVIIIGEVTVGNNVSIGAGTVVVKNIEDNAVVAGNPVRVIRYKNKA